MNRRGVRLALWALLMVAIAGAGVLLGVARIGGPAETAAVGGPFALPDGSGRIVRDRDFRGRFMLVYFGYTHCPDACPTALSHLQAALDALGSARAARIAVLFITVDPDRDTPPVMRDYVSAFGPSFTGLSGSPAAIAAVEAEYRVYAEKHPESGGDYTMDHSSIIYVMDPNGRLAASFTHETPVVEMTATLRALGA